MKTGLWTFDFGPERVCARWDSGTWDTWGRAGYRVKCNVVYHIPRVLGQPGTRPNAEFSMQNAEFSMRNGVADHEFGDKEGKFVARKRPRYKLGERTTGGQIRILSGVFTAVYATYSYVERELLSDSQCFRLLWK